MYIYFLEEEPVGTMVYLCIQGIFKDFQGRISYSTFLNITITYCCPTFIVLVLHQYDNEINK